MSNKVYMLYSSNIESYQVNSIDTNLLIIKNKETAYSIAEELNKYGTLSTPTVAIRLASEEEMRRVLKKVCYDKQILDEIMRKVFEYYRNGKIIFNINELYIV